MEMRGNMELQKPVSQSKLLLCPFCGSENIEKKIQQNFPGVFTVIIGCADCPGNPIEVGKSKDVVEQKAVERWNRRHYPPEVQQAVERMKPKKVTYDDSSLGKPGVPEFWIAHCPECKQPIDFNDTPFEFCRRCGQALDWEA
ncbi:MAG: Lar family restriction alleviation protein [Oxalobacter sp.]|nr:Lar family restriction alleviation protein [Oxalobacter sp.]